VDLISYFLHARVLHALATLLLYYRSLLDSKRLSLLPVDSADTTSNCMMSFVFSYTSKSVS